MQQLLASNSKNITYTGLAVLLLCLAAFGFTGNLLLLAAPFGLLFFGLMLINWKAAFWILLFTIPCSIQIWFQNETLSTSVPDEPIMWLFLLMVTALFANNPKIMPKWYWKNPLVLILAAQYIWLIVAVIYSKELFFSLKFLAAKTWFLASFAILPVLVFKDKKDFKRAFLLVIIPTTILAIVILYKHYRLGFNFSKIQVALRYLFYNHVDYSTFLSMVFPALCVAFVLNRKRNLFFLAFMAGLILLYLAAIHFAYARAAVLAVIFAFVVMIGIRLKLVNLIMPGFYAIIFLVVSYMVTDNKYIDYRPDFRQTYMHKSFKEHLEATFKGTDMSSMERVYRWIAAVRMSTEEPVKGYGPNSFYYYYKPYTVSSFVTYVSRNPERSTTHNYFLLMLVEQGWPAMILYAVLVFAFFAQAQKVYHRFKDKFYKACTLAVAMVFAACFINNFFSELIETHKIGSIFYLSISLLIVLDHKSRQERAAGEKDGTKDTTPVSIAGQ